MICLLPVFELSLVRTTALKQSNRCAARTERFTGGDWEKEVSKCDQDIIDITSESEKYLDAHTEGIHVSELDPQKVTNKERNKYDLAGIIANSEYASYVDATKDVHKPTPD